MIPGSASSPRAQEGAARAGGAAAPRPLRVTFAIDNLASGGAQRQVAELASQLGRTAGVEASVVVYRPEDFHAAKLRAAGVRVERVARRSSLDPSFPLRLAGTLRALAPDVVHAFLLHPALWNLLAVRTLPPARRPLLIAAERSSLVATSRSHWLRQALVYRGCDAVTVNAERVAGDIQAKLGVDPRRIHYLPNGIDLEGWTAAAALPPPWPIDRQAGEFHLALVGSYRPVKNHALVLSALERLGVDRTRGWRLWFVGDPNEGQAFADALRRSVEEKRLGDVVRLAPATLRIPALMSRMDGILLPSRYEGFPNVVLEAMALGVPVLASRVGDVPNLVDDGRTGFLLPRLDAEALAEGLLRLRTLASAEREALGARARAHVASRFAIERVAGRHLELYRALLAARGRASAPEVLP